MASTKFYLDTRGVKPGNPAQIKVSISCKGKSFLVSIGTKVLPTQWDKAAEKVVNHPHKLALNGFLVNRKQVIDTLLLKLIESGELQRLSTADLKRLLARELDPDSASPHNGNLFAKRFMNFAKVKKGRTREIYEATYKRLEAFAGARLCTLCFEDITKEWLTGFDTFLSKTSPSKNARNIHMRNIRAVFNEAIDDELTAFYPFRRFKIRNVATPKRSLTVEQLRMLFSYPVNATEEKYLDTFKLIFFLCGINIVDLCNLKSLYAGRAEYHRAKTGRLYSVKVEPEALEIINKYRGKSHLLDILDRYVDYKDYAKRLNMNLQQLGPTETGIRGKIMRSPSFLSSPPTGRATRGPR